MDFEKIVDLILSRCKEQSKFYHEVAYRSDYKDETISRIVDLGIAYDDVYSFIEMLIATEIEKQELNKNDTLSSDIQSLFESEFKKFVEKQSQVATATNGSPTAVGRADCDSNETTENIQENALEPVVNSVDNNVHK